MANPTLPMYPDASGDPRMLPQVASALAPQSFAPTPLPGPAKPPFVAPAVDPNITMMLGNMKMPSDARVAPNSFGGVGGIPPAPAPVATPAPVAGPAPSAAPAFAPTNAATPADRAYYAAAQSSPPLFPPMSPAAAAQAASDRSAIMNNVVNPVVSGVNHVGAGVADAMSIVPRGLAGAANTALRLPNAFGANIPYIPDNGWLSSATPFTDRLNASEAAAAPKPAAAAAPAAKPAAAAAPAAPAAPTYTADRLARAGQGADGGQLSPALADRLANPLPAAAAVTGAAMPAGIRDPYATINAGFNAQADRARGFMDQALNYINGGSDIFDRATRGRAIANILGAVMGPNNQGSATAQGMDAFNNTLAGMRNADVYANATMHGADMGLIGQLSATGERASEFAQTPITTGAEANPMGPYYPNLPSYGLPGGVQGGQAQPPRPVGGAATRQEAAKPQVGRTYRDKQGNEAIYQADGTYKKVGS